MAFVFLVMVTAAPRWLLFSTTKSMLIGRVLVLGGLFCRG